MSTNVAAFIALELASVAEQVEAKLSAVRNKYLIRTFPIEDGELPEYLIDGVMLDTALILIDPAFRAAWVVPNGGEEQ